MLDPIDGTRGFVGLRQYAVCLGLLDQGKVRRAWHSWEDLLVELSSQAAWRSAQHEIVLLCPQQLDKRCYCSNSATLSQLSA